MSDIDLNKHGPDQDGPDQSRGADGELPDTLRWQLRAMRRDQPPSRDLWSGIAARLGEQSPPAQLSVEQAAEQPVARPIATHNEASAASAEVIALRPRQAARNRWMAPLALAASVAALAIVISAQFRAPQTPSVQTGVATTTTPVASTTLMQREADGMTRQYQAAMQEIAPVTQQSVAFKPAFDELDRNAALILDALSHDPNSRLLLEQLRRTYARRLALAQRVAYT